MNKYYTLMSFKTRILYVFTALMILSGVAGIQKASACHWGSGEIFVNYTGAGKDGCTNTTEYKYDVYFTMYFACQTCTSTVNAHTGQVVLPGTTQAPIPLNFTLITSKITSQLCPLYADSNSCDYPNNRDKYPAYQKFEYVAKDVVLPYAARNWTFQIDPGSARPNPVNVTSGNFYVEAMINNLDEYNNSSPRFDERNDPMRYICINQPNKFLNKPVDPNGDSLVVSNYMPLNGPNAPLTFITPPAPGTPYSWENLVDADANDPYRLDPFTGTAYFTPTKTGAYQLAFMVTKYQKGTGKLLGYSMRDMNVQFLVCNEPPPELPDVPASISNGTVIVDKETNVKMIYTCPGSPLTFTSTANAVKQTSQIYMEALMSAKMDAAGAAFNVTGNGTTRVSGELVWTPTENEIGDHVIQIDTKDSTCSGTGYAIVTKTSTIYTIRVTPGVDLGPDVAICAINMSDQQLYAAGGKNLVLRWEEIIDGTVQPTPVFIDRLDIINPVADSPNVSVTYVVHADELIGSTCRNKDTVHLYIDTATTINPFPATTVLCHPDFLQLDARLRGLKPTGNLLCGDKDPIACDNPTTVEMFGTPAFGRTTKYDTLGSTSPRFSNNSKSSKMQYLITKQEMKDYGFFSGTIKSISFDVTVSDPLVKADVFPYQNFKIMMGCTQQNELSSSVGFERDNRLVEVYSSPTTLTFPVGTYNFPLTTPYNWDTTQNLLIVICYANAKDTACSPINTSPILRFVQTEYISSLTYKAPNSTIPTVCNVITGANIDAAGIRPKFTFTFCEAPSLDHRFWWQPAALLSDSSIEQPLAYIPRTTKYMVETFGRRGCILRDSVMVYVPINNYNITPFDSTICYGAEATLQVNGTNKDSYLYKWYEYEDGNYKMATTTDCNTCRNVRVRPLKTTHYKIAVYDSVFCIDTVDAIVKVLPRPDVKLLTRDTVIRYGQSIQLLASGARQYSWIPSGSLSTPNTSAPLATPVEPTSYVVTGIAANGCRTMDTVRVDIDYRDNILVPTAFSPNGDGKNDVFRVANLTFQRIMEFRVFNRWGQEIYSTNDIKGGWDGTWKGEPQPVDNYRYLIRVAFPDGIVETYKGDVTLIR